MVKPDQKPSTSGQTARRPPDPDPLCQACQPAGIQWTVGANWAGAGAMTSVVRIFEPPRERLHDAPGRPSSRDLVRQEAERRVATRTAPRLLKTFGSELSVWLRETYPGLPQMEPRTVENVVRDIWRRGQSNI